MTSRWPAAGPRLLLVLLAFGVALGAVQPPLGEEALEASSIPGGPTPVGRVEAPAAFDVLDVRLFVAAFARAAAGTPDAPVELSDAPARVTTEIAADHWLLAFDVVARAEPGLYAAALSLDGQEAGRVAFAAPAEAASREATLVFDLGPTISTTPEFLLRVGRATTGAEPRVVTLASSPRADFTWIGEDGAVNPSVQAEVGQPLRIAWRNEDGIIHNLVVRDAAGKVVAGPTRDADAKGDGAELAWTPGAAGEYAYVCRYHATTMKGVLLVA